MALAFFNSMGRKVEEFSPQEEGRVRMYTCGPTVYNYPHVGNYRTFVFEDILRRYLKFKGFKVTQVMNLTDVDDKTIKGSQKEGIPLARFTERYAKAFFEDLDALRIERAEYYPKATEFIYEMVRLVKKLMDKGFAYEGEGSVYFDITKFKEYGKLSGLVIGELRARARVKVDEYKKEEAQDFALWKGWDAADGEVLWETEIGKGRPGWHIECSAMSMKLLGETFDIHAGGVDLTFPHHENEIAQSEAATGKQFVRYWLHSEHLRVEGQRMAKSLGNFYTLRELTTMRYDPIAVRYLLLSAHYRAQMNFTFEGLQQAASSVERLRSFAERIENIATTNTHSVKLQELTDSMFRKFEEAMDADLNTPLALGALFDYIRDANRVLDTAKISDENRQLMLDALHKIDSVLSVMKTSEERIPPEIQEMIKKRDQARAKKDWGLADKIRNEIDKKGFVIQDTPARTRVKKK